jgi:hypothetical protein
MRVLAPRRLVRWRILSASAGFHVSETGPTRAKLQVMLDAHEATKVRLTKRGSTQTSAR